MRLKIMPDFCSSGIWKLNKKNKEICMCEFDELNLPNQLIKEFEAWVKFYDLSFSRKVPASKRYTHPMKSRVKAINEKGLVLAQWVKKLFPKAYVEYWGEDEKGMLRKKEIHKGKK
jgi:hypothetical protein